MEQPNHLLTNLELQITINALQEKREHYTDLLSDNSIVRHDTQLKDMFTREVIRIDEIISKLQA